LQYIVITGGNAGLGLATAKLIAKMGKPNIIIGSFSASLENRIIDP
jgi:short-subunit dehydrogenase involved in D-alanine esterification of teichoic acids